MRRCLKSAKASSLSVGFPELAAACCNAACDGSHDIQDTGEESQACRCSEDVQLVGFSFF